MFVPPSPQPKRHTEVWGRRRKATTPWAIFSTAPRAISPLTTSVLPNLVGEGPDTGPSAPDAKEDNLANFISCVISRKKEDLERPSRKAHFSAGLAHLANASYRLGRTLNFDPQTEQVKNDAEANSLLCGEERGYRPPFVIPQQV